VSDQTALGAVPLAASVAKRKFLGNPRPTRPDAESHFQAPSRRHRPKAQPGRLALRQAPVLRAVGVRVYSTAAFVEPVEARSSAGPVWRLRPSAQLIRPTWL
jgi:hypothetical protein